MNDASWDFAVCADFASTADFLTYRDHPEHQARIRSLVEPITAERVAVQFRT
ncbi:Dabb family protein [Aquihabitans daechungensis]|uniref:Dabb family protein n=1 Tax=Aquihabitans daechungensis TaxID=1052257 RepID=UPI003BA38D6E